jgi:hypothetical protein
MLPLLILPFTIILFPILGGGNHWASHYSKQMQTGLNLQLPDAHFLKKKEPDKLDLYEASGKDSDKLRMALRSDPYRMNSAKPGHPDLEKVSSIRNIFEKSAEQFPGEDLTVKNPSMTGQETDKKANELMEKLGKLKDQLNSSSPVDSQYKAKTSRHGPSSSTDRIPSLKANGNSDHESDPEMDQLNRMLDKVMAIQHPESITDFKSAKSSYQKSLTYAVSKSKDSDEPAWFGDREAEDTMGIGNKDWFYGLAGNQPVEMEPDNAIKAVVQEDQTLVSGSTIKVRLLTDIRVN